MNSSLIDGRLDAFRRKYADASEEALQKDAVSLQRGATLPASLTETAAEEAECLRQICSSLSKDFQSFRKDSPTILSLCRLLDRVASAQKELAALSLRLEKSKRDLLPYRISGETAAEFAAYARRVFPHQKALGSILLQIGQEVERGKETRAVLDKSTAGIQSLEAKALQPFLLRVSELTEFSEEEPRIKNREELSFLCFQTEQMLSEVPGI